MSMVLEWTSAPWLLPARWCPEVAIHLVWPGSAEELTAHLAENRTAVEAGPATRHDGVGEGMSTYFRDPNGSLLEFIVYTARA